jgi:hypothetical protein
MPVKSEKKYFKTTIIYEVLSEDKPVQWESLQELGEEVTDGMCSGRLISEDSVLVTVGELRDLCEKHGTDPSFFIRDY